MIERCASPLYPPASEVSLEGVLLFLGLDRDGVPLEVAAIETREGDLLVIHAMRMRRRFAAAYAEVMRWA